MIAEARVRGHSRLAIRCIDYSDSVALVCSARQARVLRALETKQRSATACVHLSGDCDLLCKLHTTSTPMCQRLHRPSLEVGALPVVILPLKHDVAALSFCMCSTTVVTARSAAVRPSFLLVTFAMASRAHFAYNSVASVVAAP